MGGLEPFVASCRTSCSRRDQVRGENERRGREGLQQKGLGGPEPFVAALPTCSRRDQVRGEKEKHGREGLQQKGLGGPEPFCPAAAVGRTSASCVRRGAASFCDLQPAIASKQGGAREKSQQGIGLASPAQPAYGRLRFRFPTLTSAPAKVQSGSGAQSANTAPTSVFGS